MQNTVASVVLQDGPRSPRHRPKMAPTRPRGPRGGSTRLLGEPPRRRPPPRQTQSSPESSSASGGCGSLRTDSCAWAVPGLAGAFGHGSASSARGRRPRRGSTAEPVWAWPLAQLAERCRLRNRSREVRARSLWELRVLRRRGPLVYPSPLVSRTLTTVLPASGPGLQLGSPHPKG
jgi:hypothetical protein